MKLVAVLNDLCMKPVNRIAENVLYDIYASEISTRDVSLSSEVDEGARGVIFQRQVLSLPYSSLCRRDYLGVSGHS